MNVKKLGFAAVAVFTLSATTIVSVSPAAAWCRWRRCGWGWGGPGILAAPFVAAGVVAGAAVGTAAAVAGAPYRGYGGVCPAGWHLGPAGRRCRPNY